MRALSAMNKLAAVLKVSSTAFMAMPGYCISSTADIPAKAIPLHRAYTAGGRQTTGEQRHEL